MFCIIPLLNHSVNLQRLQLLKYDEIKKTHSKHFYPCTLTTCPNLNTNTQAKSLHFHNLKTPTTDTGLRTHANTCTYVCMKSFLWLDLRHGATTHAWNHLCRHTSINQHRKDVWHHETTRFTTQAKSSKCFHTELCNSALLSVSFTCVITLLVVWSYLYFTYSVQCKVVFSVSATVLSLC